MSHHFQFYRKVSLYFNDEKLFSYSVPARQSRWAVLRAVKRSFQAHDYVTHAVVRKRDGSEITINYPLGWRSALGLLLTS